MGKVSEALERRKKEKTIKTKRLVTERGEYLSASAPQAHGSSQLYTENGLSPRVMVITAPDSLEAEIFKVLRARILFPKNGKKPRVIMITSVFPGEGKTFVAVNLAVSIAMGINEHVLLLDCDFRRPNVHNMLGYSNRQGLVEYLTGKGQLSDLLIRTSVKKLSLLTAGSSVPNPSELLSSTMMKELLDEVKARYEDRYIIIDAAPSHVAAEAGVLSSRVDGIIFVVMAHMAPRQAIQKNIEDLGKKKILGVVFNGYSQTNKSYHKYYEKYYK